MQVSDEDLHAQALRLLPYLRREHTDIEFHARQFYRPPPLLASLIADIETYISQPPSRNRAQRQREEADAGRLMEKIAYAAFSGLRGAARIESCFTAGPQYDLLVSGSSPVWSYLMRLLGSPHGCDTVVVECKAYRRDKVDHDQMARMCSLLDHHLSNRGGIGVFFNVQGITGSKGPALKAARILQALFYARCSKPIVVFDLTDIRTLPEPGALVRMLSGKVRNLEELQRRKHYVMPDICNLPPHLADLAQQLATHRNR